MCAEHPAIAELTLAENRGKACAVLSGMTRARGALRLRADADSVTPIAEVKRLEAAAIQGGADLAVAPAPVRKAPWCGGRAFTGELLLLAQQRGYRIAEVPVNAADVPGSEIAVPTARSRKARRDSCHVVASCFFLSLGRGEAETPDKGLSSPNTLRHRVKLQCRLPALLLLSPNAAGAQSSRALGAVANAFGGTGLTSIEIQGA